MSRLFRLIVVAAVVLVLAGCSSISSGTIHAKQANSGYWYTVMIYCGKGCLMPMMHYQPPSWEFDLYQSKDAHGWHYVSEQTYDRFRVGDFYKEPK